MRLFIADDLPSQCVDDLRALGLEVTHEPKCSAEELPARIGDASILVVRSKKVTRAAIERAPRLALIVRAGAGFDTIDVAAASERGIFVSNCPGKNSVGGRRAGDGPDPRARSPHRRRDGGPAGRTLEQEGVRQGRWAQGPHARAGRPGAHRMEVARRARAFDMHVVAWSLPFDEERGAAAHHPPVRHAARAGLPRRRDQRAPAADRGDQAPLQRGRLRPHEAGRHLRQHEPRRDRRRACARRRHAEQGASRRARRVRPRARRRRRRVPPGHRDAGASSPAPTTSVRAPSRRRTRSPPRRCASAGSSCTPGVCPTS